MTYELLLDLKNNGFPIKVLRDIQMDLPIGTVIYGRSFNKDLMIPTLSELIEACGKYIVLRQEDFGWIAYHDNSPFKNCVGLNAIDVFMTDSASGDTPEEAVARLWIETNKK
jgi:hypothetical protein